jgi:regulator of cell morphogenesis and NO signaling
MDPVNGRDWPARARAAYRLLQSSAAPEGGDRMSDVARTATVAQIAAEHAETRPVFRRYGIDYCCRGDATVAEACRRRRLRAEEVLAELERAISAAPAQGAERDPRLQAVVAEVSRRHASERRALPYIASLLPKIAGRFRGRDGRLDLLCDAGQDLVDMLEAYMDEDERVLLPAAAGGACEVVRGEIDRHIGELEAMLAHVRSLARGFVAPEWGDAEYRALMEELETLENAVKARGRIEERDLVADAGPHASAASHPRGPARVDRAARAWAEARDEEE